MSIFQGLGASDPAASTLDPKKLFRALNKPVGSPFKFPHDIQTEVWDRWFARRDEADLVVKMNTGSGKTVIGLVIAKSSLNEGRGPAVYLVPNTQLQDQVIETANGLGLDWTADPRDPAFRQSEAILICSVHTMYNGKTRFGLDGTAGIIDVGTIIVDDAHACIPAIENQFSLRLNNSTTAYKNLLNKFSDALKEQSLAGWSDIRSGGASQAVPVPYWAWHAALSDCHELLAAVSDDECDNHPFVWPLIRQQLALCEVAFTGKEVEVRLPHPDLSTVPSFVQAKRRVYMTATLADDGVLTTKMAVSEKCVTNPVAPGSASDIGDRIILTPVETSRVLSDDDVRTSAQRWAKEHTVVVITPSKSRAENWRPYTSEIHDKTSVKDAIKRLKDEKVGLVVLVARYDGVDLPGDACRVLIIDGLPERYSPLERVEAATLGDTEAMSVQQLQRIEQGMGRGVRATDDYCAVLLLDSRLVSRLFNAADRKQLSPGTRAQYELSMQFARDGRGNDMSFFDRAVEGFLARDPNWTNASRRAVEGLEYEASNQVDPLLIADRDAFEMARAERFQEAHALLQAQVDAITDPRLRAWVKQRAASYLHKLDPVAARKLQNSARLDSRYILKIPAAGPTPRLTPLGTQADAASTFLNETYATARDLEVDLDALLLDLTPTSTSGTHKRFEAAIEKLGRLLGFNASRPDAENGVGPDNFWALGDNNYWVIECKSEATASHISRSDLEQLSHSADWFEREYDMSVATYSPVIIHPSRTPARDAVPRQNARVMTFEKLESLRKATGDYITALCRGQAYRDSRSVRDNLRQFGLSASEIEQRWTQDFRPPANR